VGKIYERGFSQDGMEKHLGHGGIFIDLTTVLLAFFLDILILNPSY